MVHPNKEKAIDRIKDVVSYALDTWGTKAVYGKKGTIDYNKLAGIAIVMNLNGDLDSATTEVTFRINKQSIEEVLNEQQSK